MDGETYSRLSEEAHKRAARYAPRPSTEPSSAGLIGAAVTGVVIAVFVGFSGTGSTSSTAAGFTVLLGFFIPFGYFKHQAHLHSKAWSREFEALRRTHDGE